LILEKTLQGQQSEDLQEFVRELEANYERRQAKLEQELAALSELRRVNAMMKEMTERLNNTTASDPRETMKICQEMLPKLNDSFRVYRDVFTALNSETACPCSPSLSWPCVAVVRAMIAMNISNLVFAFISPLRSGQISLLVLDRYTHLAVCLSISVKT